MSKKFEHKIHARVEGFELEPSPLVWDEIENNLPKKEKKRRLIFWWILPTLLLVGGLGYWAMNDKQMVIQNNVRTSIDEKIENNRSQEQSYLNDIKPNNKEQIITNQKQEVEIANKKSIEQQTFNITKRKGKRFGGITKKEKTNPNYISKENNSTPNETAFYEENIIAGIRTEANTAIEKKQVPLNFDSLLATSLIKQSVSPKDEKQLTPNPKLQTTINDKKESKKSTWNYFISLGKNFNSENFVSETSKAADLNNAQMATPGTGIISNPNPAFSRSGVVELPQAGFTFSAGLSNLKQVSNSFELETYFGIKYRNGKSFVGSDSLSGDSQYFTPGLNTYNNNLWQAELGLQLLTFINPKNKNKFFIATGLSTTATLTSNWLLANTALNKYETYKNSTRFLLVNANVGVGYKLNNGFNVQVQFQQSFNTLKVSGIKNYLQTLELKTSVPIKNKNKKS